MKTIVIVSLFVASVSLGALLAPGCSDATGDSSADAASCPAGYALKGAGCVKISDSEDCTKKPCISGFTCNQLTGKCVEIDTDAGARDGAADGGVEDAAEDAGEMDATAGDASVDAGFDAGAPDGGAVTCTKAAKKCDGDRAIECNASGTGWIFKADCTPACDQNQCITGCLNGACVTKPKICQPLETHCCDDINHKVPPFSACVKDDLLQCDPLGIEWSVKENCQQTYQKPCYLDHCRDVNQNKVCTPGDLRCSLKTLMECRADGTGWDTKETCKGCCQQSAQSAACIEGAGTDNSACQSDCDCASGYICVGWGITGDKVCREKCGPVTSCPAGQSCGSGYYCSPD